MCNNLSPKVFYPVKIRISCFAFILNSWNTDKSIYLLYILRLQFICCFVLITVFKQKCTHDFNRAYTFRRWTNITAPRISYDVTCVTHLSQSITVTPVTPIYARFVLKSISPTNSKTIKWCRLDSEDLVQIIQNARSTPKNGANSTVNNVTCQFAPVVCPLENTKNTK